MHLVSILLDEIEHTFIFIERDIEAGRLLISRRTNLNVGMSIYNANAKVAIRDGAKH